MSETRYRKTFARLAARGDGAFMPYLTLGDPDLATTERLLDLLVERGADLIELGLPFSDPVADGPVIQAAATRALASGTTIDRIWTVLARFRDRHPEIPIGLLGYANLVSRRGLERFYREARAAGVDSVLIADLPVLESGPFERAATGAGVETVLIVPPNVSPERLSAIAAATRGFTYLTSRAGVTGEDGSTYQSLRPTIAALESHGAPPPMLGFGVASPRQVEDALAVGAAGAIAGSAIVRRVAQHRDSWPMLERELSDFLLSMKEATKGRLISATPQGELRSTESRVT